MSSLRDAAVRTIYRAGWVGASRIPPGVVARLITLISALAARHNGPHVRVLRHNLSVACHRPASPMLVQAAVASHLRNVFEVLALPSWSVSEITARVTTVGEERLRTAYAHTGAVVALPHSANWDLAGAWACATGMPVTTVAEQLGEQDFRAFLAFREKLGMQVLSHQDPGTLSALLRAVAARRLVCLVADRDLAGTGVPVTWGDRHITMPAGAALVARRSGAALIPAVCAFTATGMRITFGPPVEHIPGRFGLRDMTQHVATFFAEQIALQPEDWHMLQPFFPKTDSP